MKTKITFKKVIKYSFFTGIFMILFLIFSNLYVESSTRKQIYNHTKNIPQKDIALVLGTSPTLRNGNKNWYFTYRMNAAVNLYKSGKVKHILVSGDNGRKEYNEPEKMQEALIKNGVPANKITLDFAGFRTLDSVIRSREVFGAKSIIVVSQQFHNQRALFLANHYDIDAVAYNAKDVKRSSGLKTRVREYFARAKAVLDIMVGKSPKFLGKKEVINV